MEGHREVTLTPSFLTHPAAGSVVSTLSSGSTSLPQTYFTNQATGAVASSIQATPSVAASIPTVAVGSATSTVSHVPSGVLVNGLTGRPSPIVTSAIPGTIPTLTSQAVNSQHKALNVVVGGGMAQVGGAGGGSGPVGSGGTSTNRGPTEAKVLDKRRLQELVKDVDPLEQLDDDVEEMLMQIADDFIDNVVTSACQIAKHRKANTVEVKDVQLHLERNWNMWIPGFGSEELKPYKKAATTEAHKQRMALIKKTMKKY